MSLSTLRAPISRDSLTSLTDDSLLVILRYLLVPQLLTILSLSRRLNILIVQYILPRFRTIHLPNLPANLIAISKYQLLEESILFSRRYYSHSSLYLRAATSFNRERPPENVSSVPLFKWQISSFPLDLPRLLCRLQSLTFSYFLDDKRQQSEEEKLINRCLTVYLHSTWTETLVSLKLLFDITTDSSLTEEDTRLFTQLNHLPALKHLFLHFVPNGYEYRIQLPDSLPVLSQLHSFSLQWYEDTNTVTLLRQLGPNLALLSLINSNCTLQDVLRLLSSKPSYRSTLTTLEFGSGSISDTQLSTLTSSFPALVHLHGPFSFGGNSLFTFFTLLGRLSQLREMLMFSMTIRNLRALRDEAYPLHRLPTLPSIRRLSLSIECSQTESIHLQASELFNEHLPLLGGIFCAAENVEICFELPSLITESAPLNRKLADKVKEHFPSVRNCEAPSSYPSFNLLARSCS